MQALQNKGKTASLLLAGALAAADLAAAPASSVPAARVDRYRGDVSQVVARMFNGVIPADFKRFFDRDPERRIPDEPRIIVAPADGLVLSFSETEKTRMIVISLGFTDVHVQRIPIAGRIVSSATEGAGHLPTTMPEHFKNVSVVTTMDTAIGPVEIRQITGLWTKRIANFVKPGDEVSLGQRMGRILLGSTVTLTVPKTASFTVRQYDRLFAGESVIGRY